MAQVNTKFQSLKLLPILLAVVSIFAVAAVGFGSTQAYADITAIYKSDTLDVIRLSGDDRYATSAVINKVISNFPVESNYGGNFGGLIVCTGENGKYADALCASGLSGALGYPIVLVDGTDTSLDASSTDTIRSLLTNDKGDIIILGGENSVSGGIYNALRAYDSDGVPTRIAGENRYETSSNIFAYVENNCTSSAFNKFKNAVFVSGDNYADALSVGSLCAYSGRALILVDPNLDDYAGSYEYIHGNQKNEYLIVGGENSVPSSFEYWLTDRTAMADVTANIERISGTDRYETNLAVANYYLDYSQLSVIDTIGVASGENFPDALASSYFLGACYFGPLLLISPDESSNGLTNKFLYNHSDSFEYMYIFGGENSVSEDTIASVVGYCDGFSFDISDGTLTNKRINDVIAKFKLKNSKLYLSLTVDLEYGYQPAEYGVSIITPSGVFLIDKTGYNVVGYGRVCEYYFDYCLEEQGVYIVDEIAVVYNELSATYSIKDFDVGNRTMVRFAGEDRYETNFSINNYLYNMNSSKQYYNCVVICSAENSAWPDTLCASVLCAQMGGPIVLVDGTASSLSGDEIDCINRLLSTADGTFRSITAYIVGGENSVSVDIENNLIDQGLTVHRVAGADRYATSRAVYLHVSSSFNTMVVASGENFPDALSAGSFCVSTRSPLILVDPSDSNINTDIISDKTIVLGGENSVPSAISNKFNNVTRIAGADRYETNINFINWGISSGVFGVDSLGVASGEKFADALGSSFVLFKEFGSAPLMLVKDNLSDSDISYLKNYLEDITAVCIFGGENSVSLNTIANIVFNLEDFTFTVNDVDGHIDSWWVEPFVRVGYDSYDSIGLYLYVECGYGFRPYRVESGYFGGTRESYIGYDLAPSYSLVDGDFGYYRNLYRFDHLSAPSSIYEPSGYYGHDIRAKVYTTLFDGLEHPHCSWILDSHFEIDEDSFHYVFNRDNSWTISFDLSVGYLYHPYNCSVCACERSNYTGYISTTSWVYTGTATSSGHNSYTCTLTVPYGVNPCFYIRVSII